MKTLGERIIALRHFGYTLREAEFLTLAALHSGFFLRRQYCRFLDVKSGRPDNLLVQKMLRLHHGKEFSTSKRTYLYHICARPFYTAIGEPHNRHRRMRPPFAIKTKLMALDFVLENPNHRYLTTEDEKVDYFIEERGISIDALPAKIYRSHIDFSVTERYFVDKFPVFIRSDQSQSPPVVSFCYIDEGIISTPGFATYLKQYSELFSTLPRCEILFISTKDWRARAAGRAFDRFFGHNESSNAPSHKQLFRYFHLEDDYRNGPFDRLDTADLEELKRLRKIFRDPKYEELFASWKQQKKAVGRTFRQAEEPSLGKTGASFVAAIMDQSYDFL